MSQEFLIGAGAAVGTAFVSFCGWLYYNYRSTQSKEALERQELQNEKIESRVHALSDSELNALLAKDPGGGSNTKT